MADQPRRERYKETEEEFVGEGLSRNIKEENSGSDQAKYEEWTLRELQREAEKKNVKNYRKMEREELISRLKSLG